MNTHLKTCLTIAIAVAVITFLGYHPDLAWRLYQLGWAIFGVAVVLWIYGAVYCCIENLEPKRESETKHHSVIGYEWP